MTIIVDIFNSFAKAFDQILITFESSINLLVPTASITIALTTFVLIYMRILRQFIEGREERRDRIEYEKYLKRITRSVEKGRQRDDESDTENSQQINEQEVLRDIHASSSKSHKHHKDIIRLLEINRDLERTIQKLANTSHRNIDGMPHNDWRQPLITATIRLTDEAKRLKMKSTNNLIFGIIFSTLSAAAIVYLLLITKSSPSDEAVVQRVFEYLPRFAVAAILQIVAIFFLKMHASIENDIKHNKNEITNIELKLAAGMAADQSKDLIIISELWAKEERNFILSKDQRVSGNFDLPDIEHFINLLVKLNKK